MTDNSKRTIERLRNGEYVDPEYLGETARDMFDALDEETDKWYEKYQRQASINDKLKAKFDTVETLLHEANLELERVKAERDAAVKALENVEGVIEAALSDTAHGEKDLTTTLLRKIRNGRTRMESARKLIAKTLDSIKSQSND